MDEIVKSYYGISPANVRYDNSLTPNAKLLYGDITGLADKNGLCKIGIDKLSNDCQTTRALLNNYLKELSKHHYITIVKLRFDAEILKLKNLNGYGIGNKKCVWCKINTSVLHKHHYPTPKKSGGIETVNICPNCHHEFHFYSTIIIKLILNENQLNNLNQFKRGLSNGGIQKGF